LMFVNLLLSLVYGVFVLKDVTKHLAPTLPIACEWIADAATQPRKQITISIVGTIAVMVGQVAVFIMAVWYLHSRSQRWLQPLRIVSFLILMAIGAGATIRVILLSQAFGSPSVELADDGEKTWSFGQLLPLFLLFLPMISAVEIYRGEMKVPAPMGDDQRPLVATSTDDEFDPNPFRRFRMKNMKSDS